MVKWYENYWIWVMKKLNTLRLSDIFPKDSLQKDSFLDNGHYCYEIMVKVICCGL